jgi:small subunit ribosomal protein S4
LRAKQRARRVYGVLERQFRRYYGASLRTRGMTGLILLQTLETRLDNVVFRLGWAENRAQARQLVNHGHFRINGRRADIPSMLVKQGDEITISDTSKGETYFKELADLAEKRPCAAWLDRDLKKMNGRMLRLPERAEIDGSINEQLIVEYYSR